MSFFFSFCFFAFLWSFLLFLFSSNLRADARVPSSSSCEITRTNRSWALPCSLKVDNFQSQRVRRRRGSPSLASFEDGELLRSGIGDADGIIIVDHGSRRRESNLMLGNTPLLSSFSPPSRSLMVGCFLNFRGVCKDVQRQHWLPYCWACSYGTVFFFFITTLLCHLMFL